MNDFTQIRQRIRQAQVHIEQGQWQKARGLLKGIDHPKAKGLLADVERQIEKQASPKRNLPVLPLAVMGVLAVVFVVTATLFRPQAAPPDMTPLPTIAPTSDCSEATVQAWWAEQNVALDTFTQTASAASRTMPGERLDERLATLRQFRANFPTPPTCAGAGFRADLSQLLAAMDGTIAALEGWSDGTLDSLAVTTALQESEASLRDARTQARNSLS